MTKTIRWGVGALTLAGGLAVGAFAGCGSDDGTAPPVTEPDDTGIPGSDTGTPSETGGDTSNDTGKADVGDTGTPTDSGADVDAAPPPADRRINVIFARPDEKPLYVCLGVFLGPALGGDLTKAGTKPVGTNGPFGIPDASGDITKLKPFSYGQAFGVAVADKDAQSALGNDKLQVVGYFLEANPAAAGSKTACADAWPIAQKDTKRYFAVAPATVIAGSSYQLSLTGCTAASATGECGTGTTDNREFVLQKLDTATPTTFTGDGPLKFGVQFDNLSQFAGAPPAVASFQNVDVYLQGMDPAAADGGTSTPAGAPIKLASGLSYKGIAPAAVGVALKGDPNAALFVIAQKDSTPCLGGPSATCTTSVTLPAKPYLDGYKALGGGFLGVQMMALVGSPVAGSPPKVFIEMLPTTF